MCNQFLYATSKGTVRLGDMRERAVLDSFTKVFAAAPDSATPTPSNQANQDKSFFSDVTLSISDARFMPNGTGIVTRDFMTVKLWDLRQERKPLDVISVHEYLRPKLWDLYENDCVYDGFEVGISHEGNICTGSYNNYFHVYDMKLKNDTWAEASKVPMGVYSINADLWKADANRLLSPANAKQKKRGSRSGPRSLFSRKQKSGKNEELEKANEAAAKDLGPIPPTVNPENLDYGNKVLHCAWHPKLNAIAVAGANNLFLYAQQVHQPAAKKE